jgi:hypothetical protein
LSDYARSRVPTVTLNDIVSSSYGFGDIHVRPRLASLNQVYPYSSTSHFNSEGAFYFFPYPFFDRHLFFPLAATAKAPLADPFKHTSSEIDQAERSNFYHFSPRSRSSGDYHNSSSPNGVWPSHIQFYPFFRYFNRSPSTTLPFSP